jgi:hypothetical protein
MKSLYEGILGDIETTLQNSDKYINDATRELKMIQKDLTTVKSYKTPGWRNGKFECARYCKTLLEHIGIKGEMIVIKIYVPGIKYVNKWSINIEVQTWNGNTTNYDKNIFLTKNITILESNAKTIKEVIEQIFKPNVSSILTLKKFLLEQ